MLLSQHTAAEAELSGVEHKVAGLGNVAADLAEGHFDSAALQARYHGQNGQKIVLQARNELQDKAADRKAALRSSNDYHTFMGMVRDLLAWSSGLRRSLITEEKVSDAASAQMLKTEHDNLKAEIETREKTFSDVVAIGEAMVAQDHSAVGEVKEKIESVLTERQKLHTAWQHRKVYLDQLIDVSQLRIWTWVEWVVESDIQETLERILNLLTAQYEKTNHNENTECRVSEEGLASSDSAPSSDNTKTVVGPLRLRGGADNGEGEDISYFTLFTWVNYLQICIPLSFDKNK